MDFFRRIGTARHKFKLQFFIDRVNLNRSLEGKVYISIRRGNHKVNSEKKVEVSHKECRFDNEILAFQYITLFYQEKQSEYQEKLGQMNVILQTPKGDKKMLGKVTFDVAHWANLHKQSFKEKRELEQTSSKIEGTISFQVYLKYLGEASQTDNSVKDGKQQLKKRQSSIDKISNFFNGIFGGDDKNKQIENQNKDKNQKNQIKAPDSPKRTNQKILKSTFTSNKDIKEREGGTSRKNRKEQVLSPEQEQKPRKKKKGSQQLLQVDQKVKKTKKPKQEQEEQIQQKPKKKKKKAIQQQKVQVEQPKTQEQLEQQKRRQKRKQRKREQGSQINQQTKIIANKREEQAPKEKIKQKKQVILPPEPDPLEPKPKQRKRKIDQQVKKRQKQPKEEILAEPYVKHTMSQDQNHRQQLQKVKPSKNYLQTKQRDTFTQQDDDHVKKDPKMNTNIQIADNFFFDDPNSFPPNLQKPTKIANIAQQKSQKKEKNQKSEKKEKLSEKPSLKVIDKGSDIGSDGQQVEEKFGLMGKNSNQLLRGTLTTDLVLPDKLIKQNKNEEIKQKGQASQAIKESQATKGKQQNHSQSSKLEKIVVAKVPDKQVGQSRQVDKKSKKQKKDDFQDLMGPSNGSSNIQVELQQAKKKLQLSQKSNILLGQKVKDLTSLNLKLQQGNSLKKQKQVQLEKLREICQKQGRQLDDLRSQLTSLREHPIQGENHQTQNVVGQVGEQARRLQKEKNEQIIINQKQKQKHNKEMKTVLQQLQKQRNKYKQLEEVSKAELKKLKDQCSRLSGILQGQRDKLKEKVRENQLLLNENKLVSEQGFQLKQRLGKIKIKICEKLNEATSNGETDLMEALTQLMEDN